MGQLGDMAMLIVDLQMRLDRSERENDFLRRECTRLALICQDELKRYDELERAHGELSTKYQVETSVLKEENQILQHQVDVVRRDLEELLAEQNAESDPEEDPEEEAADMSEVDE
ncbi:hypothetical protein Salat_0517300 [Sesamum alatum]|uniref:Uncharacterized protein n=1 Tax=Sesamum alatum TaxID=300844 RepID=A0AAE1Z428_9LAMI|nr:hypothetical protein Salat_0517300 [Sesamum alatum]